MPNILFTQKCVRSCPYCFANKHMSESPPEDVLSWENLVYIADFLQVSGEKRFPILGGEPTLHPEFNAMVLYLLERGFEITVFTSGIMSNAALDEAVGLFRGVPAPRLAFVCNLNDPVATRTPLAETEAVRRFLGAFGEMVVPGFNIYHVDFDLAFLFALINEYGLQRHIRLGIAHPIPGVRNLHIAIPDIDRVIERLFSFVPAFEALRVKPGLDCGFPLCRIPKDKLGWLYGHTGGRFSFGCGPVIDVGPDMSIWPCFPLSSFHKRSLFEFSCVREIQDYYADLHRKVRIEVGGIYEECDLCRYREEQTCQGGCVAHSLARFQEEEPVRMREMYP
jgi:radical SAM protein with 4Fe4S-binding SPASM domain